MCKSLLTDPRPKHKQCRDRSTRHHESLTLVDSGSGKGIIPDCEAVAGLKGVDFQSGPVMLIINLPLLDTNTKGNLCV